MTDPGATAPADLGLLEAAALLRTRALSAVELLEACQARIAARNGGEPTFDGAPGAVNAWVRLYPDLARELALAADARRAAEGDGLEPTVPLTAFARGPGYDSGNLGGEGDPLIVFTSTWNFTGFPVVALPAGLGARSGLPVGVSLIGPPDAEPLLVQAAIDLQEHELAPLRLDAPS